MNGERGRSGPPHPDIEALIRAEGAGMARIARGVLRDYPDADDAVQNAFINVHRTWSTVGQLETAAKQRAYLRQAVLHESYRIWNDRRDRREVPADQAGDFWVVQWDGAGHISAKIDLYRVWKVVAGFPEVLREVMSLFIAGYNYGEIAGMLKISVSTVRSHVSSGRRRLRRVLPEVWEED